MLKSEISRYYQTAALYSPPFFANREFAILNIDGYMTRHLSFNSISDLRMFLVANAPDHVYMSSAKYKNPGNPDMQQKKIGWMGSDLVFDIDFDHLEIPSMENATKQAQKLIGILEEQFGLKKAIMVFSGGRGFHIHVYDECVQTLGNAERREISDFFTQNHANSDSNPNRVDLDTVVTCDYTRLIRLPGTLNVKKNSAKMCFIIGGI